MNPEQDQASIGRTWFLFGVLGCLLLTAGAWIHWGLGLALVVLGATVLLIALISVWVPLWIFLHHRLALRRNEPH